MALLRFLIESEGDLERHFEQDERGVFHNTEKLQSYNRKLSQRMQQLLRRQATTAGELEELDRTINAFNSEPRQRK
jgi:hypothetical protein